MIDLKPATSYHTVFDTTRVKNFNRNVSYQIPIETGTGHYKTARARFTDESGWEYFHLDYDKWLLIPDGVEIFEGGYYIASEELLDRFLSQNPDYLQYRTNFVCDFSSLKEVIDSQSFWWEDRYQDMLDNETLPECIKIAEFEGRYLLFTDCDI